MLSKLKEIAVQCQFTEAAYIDVCSLNFYPEVRAICEGNVCQNYAASWACPPAIGTVDACKERVQQYDKMLLFSHVYQLEDSFDFEGMVDSLQDFKHLTDLFHHQLEPVLPGFLLLSNEGCGRCVHCTYPGAPCRFPHLLHHSLEGYGFMVNELAKDAGIHYNNGPNTVTYFGALLFNSSDL